MEFTVRNTDDATAYGGTDAPAPAPARSGQSPDPATAFGAADAPSFLATARSMRRPGPLPGLSRSAPTPPSATPCSRKHISTLALGAWNVRTLTDADNDRPERRTALVAHELKRLNMDIVALSETRFPDEGQLQEAKAGYTFFWKGLPKTEKRIHGVGFAVRTAMLDRLKELPVGISERLMTLRLEIAKNQHMSVISAYAPTLDADDEHKEAFYSALDLAISRTPATDKLVVLGDFNARVGNDRSSWPAIGAHGIGKKANSNGLLLLSKCTEHEFVITNTLFRVQDRHKGTWQHPRSKHWHQIDFAITRARDRADVMSSRAMCGSDSCFTDHRLVKCVMRLKFCKKANRQQARPQLNVSALQHPDSRQELQTVIAQKLTQMPDTDFDDVQKSWEFTKTALLKACAETIGTSRKKHQDWFDDNDQEILRLVERKRQAFLSWQTNPKTRARKHALAEAKRVLQRRTRQLKNEWWKQKAAELQALSDSHDSKAFFAATKAIYGPSNRGPTPLRTAGSDELVKDPASIRKRWLEHFSTLLNRDVSVDPTALEALKQYPVRHEMSCEPSLEEVKRAARALKNGKAAGPDGIPAEVLKYGGPELTAHLHRLLLQIWRQEEVPADLRDAQIVTIFKKGDKAVCGNYRGISLLSTVGKLLSKVLLNRLSRLAEDVLPESQCGFRSSRGTVDMVFALRQLQEKSREQQQPLYVAFYDLTKAFDSVHRETLWSILVRYGCPHKFVRIVRLLHDGMEASVLCDGEATPQFPVQVGVKQGCVIAPTLFTLFMGAVLQIAKPHLTDGVGITYRLAGKVLNLRRLQSKNKVSSSTIVELQYADDTAVCSSTEAGLQRTTDAFANAYRRLGLTLNATKTEVLYQPARGYPSLSDSQPKIEADDSVLRVVPSFRYLGSCVTNNVSLDQEIENRISSAAASFGKLRRRVFDNRNLTVSTKTSVYRAVVLPTLLYGSETWTLYRHQIRQLEKFHQRCLRGILHLHWSARVTNAAVLERASATSVEAMLHLILLRWAGHVSRMSDDRVVKRVFYSQLAHGKRKLGAPKKRYKDALKSTLKDCDIDSQRWEALAADRLQWRRAVHLGCRRFEELRLARAAEKRVRRKEREDRTTSTQMHQTPVTRPVSSMRSALLAREWLR